MADINSILDLSSLARGRRQTLGLSQAELASRANVSRQWVTAFESGRPGAELRLILRLLEALELRLSVNPLEDPGSARPTTRGAVDLDALLEAHRETPVEGEPGR